MMNTSKAFENKAFLASLGAEKAESRAIVELLPFVNASGFSIFLATQDETQEWCLPQDLTEQVLHYIRYLVVYEAYLFGLRHEAMDSHTEDSQVEYGKEVGCE